MRCIPREEFVGEGLCHLPRMVRQPGGLSGPPIRYAARQHLDKQERQDVGEGGAGVGQESFLLEEGDAFRQEIARDVWREGGDVARLSGFPVKASDLIREDHAADGKSLGESHLEWITLRMGGDRARQKKADLGIVGPGGEDRGRPPPRLFVAHTRSEGDPDEIAAAWNVHLPDFLADRGI